MLTLRPYQLEAVAKTYEAWNAGVRRVLVVMPTGTGKTVVFARIGADVVARGARMLVLAHRTELLGQAQAKLRAAGVWAEIEQGKRRAGFSPVVIASVQTLKGKRLEELDPDAFDTVVIDEAHHAVAPGYRIYPEYFGRAKVLGVTATADRLDGAGLGEVFDACPFTYELRDAIRDGYLVPIKARRIELEGVDVSNVKTRAGDFAQNELAEIMVEEEALHGVAIPVLEQTAGRRTIVFGVDVAHAHALAEVMNRYEPGCARAIDGSAHPEARAGVLEAFRAGHFRILVNCALFTEGFDEPGISCVVVARLTKSRSLYTQMVGRGTRPIEPPTEATADERLAAIAASDKPDLLLLDVTGEAGKHRLVGPGDVLAGRQLEDDVREDLEKRLDGQLELDELLQHAEDEVRRRRERAGPMAVAKYLAKEFDAFCGELPEPARPPPAAWAREPATGPQLSALGGFGLDKIPEAISKADASRLIDALRQRRQLGLCTLKMARLLGRNGVDASMMSMAEAGKQIQRLRDRWDAQRSMRRPAAGGGDA